MTKEIELELDLGIFGFLPCRVTYTYSPGERGSSMEPGSDEEYEIVDVVVLCLEKGAKFPTPIPVPDRLFSERSADAIVEAIKEVENDY
jgi:hypothetical protein